MIDPDLPLARALRALQRLDELSDLVASPRPGEPISDTVARGVLSRRYLIEAESILGAELGLTCTGEPSVWNVDGAVAGYDHNGDTCPIHEWLVPADQTALVEERQ